MLSKCCTRKRLILTGLLAVVAFAASPVQAQSVLEGYRVTLSRFGGDGTLPRDLGYLCLWDDGIWTLTDYVDVGFWIGIGRRTYLEGGVEGEEHMSMVARGKKGDLILGAPANSTEISGQDLLIVASAKWKREDFGCVARQAKSSRRLLDAVESLTPRRSNRGARGVER